MTTEQERLCALIDGHCEAMKAQVVDRLTPLEWRTPEGEWRPGDGARLFCDSGPYDRVWYRLAPVPRLVPLDQSDFLGPNRVTALMDSHGTVCFPVSVSRRQVRGGGPDALTFQKLIDHNFQCSRDNGATWGPCSKPEVSK